MIKHLPFKTTGFSNAKATAALRQQLLLLSFVLMSAFYSMGQQVTLTADVNSGSPSFRGELRKLHYTNGNTFFFSERDLWVVNSSEQVFRLTEAFNFVAIGDAQVAGDKLFFTGDAGIGLELYVSDGTPEGTYLVKDIATGSQGSDPMYLTAVNNILYFSATQWSAGGRELWRSDGNLHGTYRVKDIIKGSGSSNPTELENVNGIVYFAANEGIHGYELWKSDGTEAGTVLVKDVRPGSTLSSSPKEITNVNGTVYFTAVDGNGRELWKSDGTAAGTVLVKDIYLGTSNSSPDNLFAVGSTLYFGANNGTNGRELWKSNGTAAGTVMVKDITPGAGSNTGGGYPHLSQFTLFNNQLYFMAYTDRPRIWTSDGTAAGTIPISPLEKNFINVNSNLTVFENELYYVNNGSGSSTGYMEMWRTNGTPTDHRLVSDRLGAWINNDMELTPTHDRIYFTTRESTTNWYEQLWMTQGTPETTAQVTPPAFNDGSHPKHITTVGESVYFAATSGSQYGLFKSNGTAAGTSMVRDFYMIDLYNFFGSNGLLYFVADDHRTINEQTLWRSDGTYAGTYPLMLLANSNVRIEYEVSNNLVYVSAGNKLFRTDGTTTGTIELKSFTSDILWMAHSSGGLLLGADNGSVGAELWKSNGTVSGTVLQRDIRSGASSALPKRLTETFADPAVTVNGVAYFMANAGGDANLELWRSDGTITGTRMVKNDETDRPFTPRNNLAVSNGVVYFLCDELDEVSWEDQIFLWKSDGTATGTIKLRLLESSYDISNNQFTFIGGGAYFYLIAQPGHHLYRSDGTPAGTQNIFEFAEFPLITPMSVAHQGTKTYISAGHDYHSLLLRTDGTSCGTFYVNFGTDPNEAYVHIYLATMGNSVYLNGYDQSVGEELFNYTDNVAACTAGAGGNETLTHATSENEREVSSYPNPFVDEISLNVSAEGATFALDVQTMNGTRIEHHSELKTNYTYTIGRDWAPGIYLMKIKTEKGMMVRKVVKNTR
jgi:ELWxxDGT repeat protein